MARKPPHAKDVLGFDIVDTDNPSDKARLMNEWFGGEKTPAPAPEPKETKIDFSMFPRKPTAQEYSDEQTKAMRKTTMRSSEMSHEEFDKIVERGSARRKKYKKRHPVVGTVREKLRGAKEYLITEPEEGIKVGEIVGIDFDKGGELTFGDEEEYGETSTPGKVAKTLGMSAYDLKQWVDRKATERDDASLLSVGADPDLLDNLRMAEDNKRDSENQGDVVGAHKQQIIIDDTKRRIAAQINAYQRDRTSMRASTARNTLSEARARQQLRELYDEEGNIIDLEGVPPLARGDIGMPSVETEQRGGVDLTVHRPTGVSPVVQVRQNAYSRALTGKATPYTTSHRGMKSASVEIDESRLAPLMSRTKHDALTLRPKMPTFSPVQAPERYYRRYYEETLPGRQVIIREQAPPRPQPMAVRTSMTLARPRFTGLVGGGKIKLDLSVPKQVAFGKPRINMPVQRGMKAMASAMPITRSKYHLVKKRPGTIASPSRYNMSVQYPKPKFSAFGGNFNLHRSTVSHSFTGGGMIAPKISMNLTSGISKGFANVLGMGAGLRSSVMRGSHISVAPFSFSPHKINLGKFGTGFDIKGFKLNLDVLKLKKKKKGKKNGKKGGEKK